MNFLHPSPPRKAFNTLRKVYKEELQSSGVFHYSDLEPSKKELIREKARKQIIKSNINARLAVIAFVISAVLLVFNANKILDRLGIQIKTTPLEAQVGK